ncbi:MAG TPA: GerMN domain-containing protein [Acidobacteriota bacterium]|nr:GerMN domain-containing protein [Acidobacteriota bacterium]HRV08794.1 GerMN domain-containing protein [Acidobacteriota bacterium]
MRNLRWAIAVLLTLLVAVWVSYEFYTRERDRRAQLESLQDESDLLPAPEQLTLETVTLFRYRPGTLPGDEGFLVPFEVSVPRYEEEARRARELLSRLLREGGTTGGPGTQLLDAASPATDPLYGAAKLRGFYLLADGTAVVDLELDRNRMVAGIVTEYALVESIVRTLRANVSGVTQVQLLVDGHMSTTLLGHVLITRPFR